MQYILGRIASDTNAPPIHAFIVRVVFSLVIASGFSAKRSCKMSPSCIHAFLFAYAYNNPYKHKKKTHKHNAFIRSPPHTNTHTHIWSSFTKEVYHAHRTYVYVNTKWHAMRAAANESNKINATTQRTFQQRRKRPSQIYGRTALGVWMGLVFMPSNMNA